MKKVISCISIVVVIAIAFIGIRMATAPTDIAFVQTAEMPKLPDLNKIMPTDLSEKVAIAIDDQIAYKNTDEIQPTASTAKMIMALMVVEKKPLTLGETGPMITITPEFYNKYLYYVAHNGSNTAVRLGENISEYDGLASALLASSNNMADTLAIWAFGSLENYKQYTESRLAEWGLKNTTIGIDASGYSDTTKSTAADLAIVAQKLMANPVLAEIVGKKSHTIPVAGTVENTNKTLGEFGIVGVKTGFINKASGYCLATAYKLQEHVITVVVLGAQSRENSFTISKQVVEKLQTSLTETEIVQQNQEVGHYESWWGGKTPILATDKISVVVWSSINPTLTLSMDESRDNEEATGILSFTYGNKNTEISVTTNNFRASPSFWDRLQYALFMK